MAFGLMRSLPSQKSGGDDLATRRVIRPIHRPKRLESLLLAIESAYAEPARPPVEGGQATDSRLKGCDLGSVRLFFPLDPFAQMPGEALQLLFRLH